ncbi:MAG: DUF262 domain-containing protein, partial [Gemmataceae bacterium]
MAKSHSQPIDVVKSTLGDALKKQGPLRVPSYQREYSWKPDRVRKLYFDFNRAMAKKLPSYFLGTIVLTPGDVPSIVDGQQRLATTSIFLAAARDAFIELGRTKEAKSIEKDFLFTYDRKQQEDVPLLTLNTDDRAYMLARVLTPPEKRVR